MTPEDKELDDNELHIAVRLGDVDATRSALRKGYDPNTVGLFEWSALHEACYNGDLEIVEILLEHCADPNKADHVSANTSLHYACSEGHAECLDALIKQGGKPDIQNSNGEDCIQQTSDPDCLKILKIHGYSKESNSSNQNMPEETDQTKTNLKTTELNESIDSGRASPTTLSLTSKKLAWDELKEERKTLSSPVRSIGSSYGSLSSLGSSSCSAADDSAGEFTMSFRYNSKKQELKVCMWEIRLVSLVAASQMPKGTNIHLYLKSTIIPDDEFSSNPMMKRKSDTIHLYPGEHSDTADSNQSMVSNWLEREAKLEFKNPITLEYKNVSKQLVHSSEIQVCLCVRPKRSIMGSKSKQTAHDPVLASREFKMSDAVKRLMKESYEAERHHVLGLTRQSIPLEDIITHKGISNQSFNSDPNVRIHMSSLLDPKHSEIRCASDGDLQRKPVHNATTLPQTGIKNEGRGKSNTDKAQRYSPASLKSVSTHTTPISRHTQVPVFSISKSMETLDIKTHKTRDNPKVKVQMPQFNSGYYSQVDYNLQARGRSTNHHSRNKPKSGKKLLAAAANNVVSLDTSVVQAIDNEENSVGSPSEKKIGDFDESGSDLIYTHQRTNSSNSFTEVDESPSPSRRRKPYTYNSPKHTRQLTVPQVKSAPRRPHKDWSVQMGPKDTAVNFEHSIKHKEAIEMQTMQVQNQEHLDSAYRTYHDPRLKPRQKQLQKTKQLSSKEQALRRLVYDESDLNDVNLHSASNPCFVND